ncbi:phage replisome organizer N-terminal domain-containing protein [Pediococcus pentosaceus]|uniref:phage replisome organizer N-terminal domain-containing protein n=1 Tax=Pediococcus pentosaceus TaxID=1255 RepID=UPI0021A68A34|nr:phage replisome organizer N-terminal domain-containing protein [Pediococcus pentosaceus]MCT3033264.1 replication protein [Pediococcus pentosaceus]
MTDNKKYYYLKLKDNFFESDELKILQNYNNGKNEGYVYSDILLKMYLKSLKYDGKLVFKEYIPYSPEMLATVTNHSVGEVKDATEKFEQLGLVEILSDGAIFMNDIQLYVGKSSTEGDRIRAYRKKLDEAKKVESVQMYDKRTPEIRDKNLDIRDKSLEKKDNNKYLSLLATQYENLSQVPPTKGILVQMSTWLNKLTQAGSTEAQAIIAEAMKISHSKGKIEDEFWKVTVGILRNWFYEKILSVVQIEQLNRKMSNRNFQSNKVVHTETLPKWLEEGYQVDVDPVQYAKEKEKIKQQFAKLGRKKINNLV